MYAGHSSAEGRIQELKVHLKNVSKLAGEFSGEFGGEEWGILIGMMHDIGKYSDKAQNRILHKGTKTDHSTAGAQEIFKRFGLLPAAYCVAGHHGGLPDGGSSADTGMDATLYGRLKKDSISDYRAWETEIEIGKISCLPITPLEKPGFSISFFIRMIFSCLVDADFLDTESFMSDGTIKRGEYDEIHSLWGKLEKYIFPFLHLSNRINNKRSEILKRCIEMGERQKGLYSLTVPTGGGKTISSMAFALKHMEKHHMKRVIYVIPYTSIIEQNAQVFRDILGDENILEHHANVDYQDEQKKLATENWDTPVVVTTNVQFFESLFASKTSKCRKLHNIANSVLIFDEAQMLPLSYIIPCVQAVRELVKNYGCTAVFCTATQPALNKLIPEAEEITELCGGKELFDFFKRTEIKDIGPLMDVELADRMNRSDQCLCIVNNRKHAKDLFERLEKDGRFHLSTMMCPVHRKEILKEIRGRLEEERRCLVVATSLIEAGVDIDFPMVYREEAGIDSMIQAAGRCNREGKREWKDSIVAIFTSEEKYLNHTPTQIKQAVEVSRMIFHKYSDVTSAEAIREYFEKLYTFKGESLDSKSIVQRLDSGQKGFSFPFAEIAKDFKIIEQETYTVIIPFDTEAQGICERIRAGERNRDLLRKVGMYTVAVYKKNFENLIRTGMVIREDEELAILVDKSIYSTHCGLTMEIDEGIGLFI